MRNTIVLSMFGIVVGCTPTKRPTFYAHNLAEQVRDVIRQIRPSTFRTQSARVAQLVALEAQLRPHTFGKERREELHQRPEQPRQV